MSLLGNLFSKQKGTLGIDIGTTSIKAVELIRALPISIETVSKENTIDALSIFSRYNINYADALIASVMREKFIDSIITNDKHFDKIKELKVIKSRRYKTPA